MSPIAIALLIMAAMILLFIFEPVPILVTAIGTSIVYAYVGLIEVKDIFVGYNNTTIVLLAGMMIIGSSLFHAGITEVIGEKVMEKLKTADEVAYVRFASVYRQFKDINTFMAELNKILAEK